MTRRQLPRFFPALCALALILAAGQVSATNGTPAAATQAAEPGAPPAVPPLHSPKSPVWPTFPFQREGSRVWERGNLLLRDLPSPLPTKRTRTYSA